MDGEQACDFSTDAFDREAGRAGSCAAAHGAETTSSANHRERSRVLIGQACISPPLRPMSRARREEEGSQPFSKHRNQVPPPPSSQTLCGQEHVKVDHDSAGQTGRRACIDEKAE